MGWAPAAQGRARFASARLVGVASGARAPVAARISAVPRALKPSPFEQYGSRALEFQ